MSEKSSLLRSSVTTDVRHDYSSKPPHKLKDTNELELTKKTRQNKFDRESAKISHTGLEFDSTHQRSVQEMENDSGIESNGHDESPCDISKVGKSLYSVNDVSLQQLRVFFKNKPFH